MNEAAILELARDASWVMLLVSGPLLAVAVIVGVAVALFQALTTIQETTLTFVPKLVVMLVTLVLVLPFMMTTLIEFTRHLFELIAVGG
jgi:flagellar biosynthesis protein FliQ